MHTNDQLDRALYFEACVEFHCALRQYYCRSFCLLNSSCFLGFGSQDESTETEPGLLLGPSSDQDTAPVDVGDHGPSTGTPEVPRGSVAAGGDGGDTGCCFGISGGNRDSESQPGQQQEQQIQQPQQLGQQPAQQQEQQQEQRAQHEHQQAVEELQVQVNNLTAQVCHHSIGVLWAPYLNVILLQRHSRCQLPLWFFAACCR